MKRLTIGLFAAFLFSCNGSEKKEGVVFTNFTLIDGNGGKPVENSKMLVLSDRIAAVGNNVEVEGYEVVDLAGKTVMPALISAHVHVGTLKGTQTVPENYTRENILNQLEKYESYGILHVLSLGTDRPMLFESGLRDSSANGMLPGARLLSGGYGFGVDGGAPPFNFAMDLVFRPKHPDEVPGQIDSLVAIKPTAVKIWVDDFGGSNPKMMQEIYSSIISEAHKSKLPVASHAYYLNDVRKLLHVGIDIIAHSVRDSVIDDATVQLMLEKKVSYIPTLTLDLFGQAYAESPEWIDDPFFKAALEPGVLEMVSSTEFQNSIKNASTHQRNVRALQIALLNIKKLYDAGVLIALGTDSGAQPIRPQGFSEHKELELLVTAGLTPLQAITVGTKNAAQLLKLDHDFGTLEKNKIADFIVLEQSPENNITKTSTIHSVYKSGKLAANSPLK